MGRGQEEADAEAVDSGNGQRQQTEAIDRGRMRQETATELLFLS